MHHSPLRYPGGKSSLVKFLKDLVVKTDLNQPVYYEMYAGGAGAGLNLLFNDVFSRIVLNDYDYHIYAFWYTVLNHSDELIELISKCDITIDNWKKQKEVYSNPDKYHTTEVGFSTFFLNRSNRSGILHKAGPIGGMEQNGKYLIDARFPKSTLIERIQKIKDYKEQITINNNEAITLLSSIFKNKDLNNSIIYLDPPYYEQGENLYLNFYKHKNHENLANLLLNNKKQNWFLTYDNQSEIKEMYKGLRIAEYSTRYTLQDKKDAKEVLIFSDSLSIPEKFRIYSRENELETFVA